MSVIAILRQRIVVEESGRQSGDNIMGKFRAEAQRNDQGL